MESVISLQFKAEQRIAGAMLSLKPLLKSIIIKFLSFLRSAKGKFKIFSRLIKKRLKPLTRRFQPDIMQTSKQKRAFKPLRQIFLKKFKIKVNFLIKAVVLVNKRVKAQRNFYSKIKTEATQNENSQKINRNFPLLRYAPRSQHNKRISP